MEDIAYKEWSDHLDFVVSSRASPWLPAYGYHHPPSPIQEIFHHQPDPFLLSDNSNQQQYLVLETIIEETSDDLGSESDKSGPTGWNSDSDADSVIHMPKNAENVEGWRSQDCGEEVPKKRRRRIAEKYSASDDDEPQENVEATSLSSRSSSLIDFESLERHCEAVLVEPYDRGATVLDLSKWTATSPDSPGESCDGFDSSDEEPGFGSSADTLHRSHIFRGGSGRENCSSETRLRSCRSFESLNLFESIPPVRYALAELSQSQSALDREREKQREEEFAIRKRDKKLTATTADLTRMTDHCEVGLKAFGNVSRSRRRGGAASFHRKGIIRFPNSDSFLVEEVEMEQNYFPTKKKSHSAEEIQKIEPSRVEVDSRVGIEEGHGRSEPCLSEPRKSHPSIENLSEDSGFGDHVSTKSKGNRRNSASSIPEDEDGSPMLESSPNSCREGGSSTSEEVRERSGITKRNSVGSSKIAEEQGPGPKGSLGIHPDDVDVKFNPGQSQMHAFDCARDEGGPFERGELENSIETPSSVPFGSRSVPRSESRDLAEFDDSIGNSCDPWRDTRGGSVRKCFAEGESTVRKSLDDFAGSRMSAELEQDNPDSGLTKTSRLPVLSTPNLLAGVDEFVRILPSAASSLTHVPLKFYDEDEMDARAIRNNLSDFKRNQSSKGFGGSQGVQGGIKGVHFCPVVSEVSWQDSYSEASSTDSSADEISSENRSLEELCEIKSDDEEPYHEHEEKSIPRDREIMCEESHSGFPAEWEISAAKHRSNSDSNLLERRRERGGEVQGSPPSLPRRNGNSETGSGNPVEEEENVLCSGPRVEEEEEKPVTPTIRVTPTFDHVLHMGDAAAQANVERRRQLSVSESNLTPADGHASEGGFEVGGGVPTDDGLAKVTTTMKKSKSRFGGFFERFSLRRRKSSSSSSTAGTSKKQGGKAEEKREGGTAAAAASASGRPKEDVTIIPLHGPDNEAEVKEIVRSVVTPRVVSAKPPLPPGLQRMPGGPRKRVAPSVAAAAAASVGSQDAEGKGGENMPAVRETVSEKDDSLAENRFQCDAEPEHRQQQKQQQRQEKEQSEKQVGLLETDLDTEVTVESAAGRKQGNVAANKKARSLINLGPGEMSVHRDRQQNHPAGYLEPPVLKSHGSVAVDDRAKSMEFLLDKENQAAILPPENELQKGGTGERVMSEHQLRVQRSLQKLNVPDWYKTSAVSQTPQGFLLKRNSETKRENQWPGLGSKTTSLSSLGSSHSATARSPTALSPSPTPQLFSRWSTSRLSGGSTYSSSAVSPSGSIRSSSFNYRQPYLGWRSQEKLSRPRTPAERLAAGLLPLQKHQTGGGIQANSQSSINLNLSDVRTSIKEVTSAIVHYVSGVQENGSRELLRSYQGGSSPVSASGKQTSSPRGSSGRLCWVESSFVGSRPLDQPETPLSITEPSSESKKKQFSLDLNPESNPLNSHRMNEGTPRMSEEEGFERGFEVPKRPSPTSTTLNDILESLLGLPPTSRSPSPGRSRPLPPLPDHQHQRQSCGDIRANASESASDPGNADFAKEVMIHRRRSDGASDSLGLVRQGSTERRGKTSPENIHPGKEETSKREHPSQLTDAIVKCRYSKCGKTATVSDAKKTFKTCHNCSHVYCSRECRRAHWERHRRICLHSRVGALCRQVLSAAKEDGRTRHQLSLLARRGYLTHGRGAVKIFFSSPESAEKFVSSGFDELGDPAYVKWSDLQPAEMGTDLFAELTKVCKSYNPDTRLVLYVAVCVVSEVPTTGAVKWERQLVSRCCKIPLDKSLAPAKEDEQHQHRHRTPPPLPPRKSSSDCVKITREMENPETLILTSLPGVAGKMAEQKVRQISFVNIQRELKERGVNLRRQFPEIYKRLCSYVEGTCEHFTPVTIYPRDVVSSKTFMCIIMPDSEPEKLELVPKDSSRVQTIDVSVERKTS